MPRHPDAPGDGAMFAQIFTPSFGTSGRVNSPSFNSRVLLLIPTVRTLPNSGAGFKSAYGIDGTIFLASYFQKRCLPTPSSEYAIFLIMMFRIAFFDMTVSRSTGVKVFDEFFDIWLVLFKHQSRRCRGSISGNRAVPLSVGMGRGERHAFFLKRVHLPINYSRGGEEFACYGKGNEVAA